LLILKRVEDNMEWNTEIRAVFEGKIYYLDVLPGTPIRLDISAIENGEIGNVFGSSSQTFTLPSSKNNNRFFKHAYKVGIQNIPAFGKSIEACVISNSTEVVNGSMILNEVVRINEDEVNYIVEITNNLVTFNETVKNTTLRQLNWSDLIHGLTVENVTSSWDDNLLGGAVFYPLVDFGTDGLEPTASVPLVDLWGFGNAPGPVGYFDNAGSPLQVQQFSPAIQVKAVLDKIFDYAGFSWESSLQPEFEELYVLPRQSDILAIEGTGFTDYGFIARPSPAILTTPGSWTIMPVNVKEYDPSNSYNDATYTYTVQRLGTYVFEASPHVYFPAFTSGEIAVYEFRIMLNGSQQLAYGQIRQEGISPEEIRLVLLRSQPIVLSPGNTVTLEYQAGITGTPPPSAIIPDTNFNTTETPRKYEGGLINPGLQFDPKTKVSDFLLGLIQKFNLVFEPVYTQPRVIKIETFDTWIRSGGKKDWTDIIDRDNNITIVSPLQNQPRELIFQDEADNDKISKEVLENAENLQWGTELVDALSDIPQGTRGIGTYFAPIVLEPAERSAELLIPKLYKFENSTKTTFKHKPRLGYKIDNIELTFASESKAYIGEGAEEITKYATLSNYKSIPIINKSVDNLHYNQTEYPPLFGNPDVDSTTAYEKYWKNYIESLYEDDNIILKGTAYFEPTYINEIRLNDRIFVDDAWYRINKINGFNITAPDLATVELIKLPTVYQPIPEDLDWDFSVLQPQTFTMVIDILNNTTSSLDLVEASAIKDSFSGEYYFRDNYGPAPFLTIPAGDKASFTTTKVLDEQNFVQGNDIVWVAFIYKTGDFTEGITNKVANVFIHKQISTGLNTSTANKAEIPVLGNTLNAFYHTFTTNVNQTFSTDVIISGSQSLIQL
jgi:hypothetical protein